jgi:lipid II:glycine glycyltransferase (peptidoglycan interpeptide bridge formation enzyme)
MSEFKIKPWGEFVEEFLSEYEIKKGSQFEAKLFLAYEDMCNLFRLNVTDKILTLESQLAAEREKIRKMREALEKTAKAIEHIQPLAEQIGDKATDLDDFASCVKECNLTKEQRDFINYTYECLEIIEENLPLEALKEIEE